MDIETYSTLALRTASVEEPLVNACFGIGGESGEILDYVKKGLFHKKPMDPQHLLAEAGDLVWYVNLLIRNLGSTWGEVLEMNIRKLEARYPDLRFDAERANNRDVAAEAVAMRGEA